MRHLGSLFLAVLMVVLAPAQVFAADHEFEEAFIEALIAPMVWEHELDELNRAGWQTYINSRHQIRSQGGQNGRQLDEGQFRDILGNFNSGKSVKKWQGPIRIRAHKMEFLGETLERLVAQLSKEVGLDITIVDPEQENDANFLINFIGHPDHIEDPRYCVGFAAFCSHSRSSFFYRYSVINKNFDLAVLDVSRDTDFFRQATPFRPARRRQKIWRSRRRDDGFLGFVLSNSDGSIIHAECNFYYNHVKPESNIMVLFDLPRCLIKALGIFTSLRHSAFDRTHLGNLRGFFPSGDASLISFGCFEILFLNSLYSKELSAGSLIPNSTALPISISSNLAESCHDT